MCGICGLATRSAPPDEAWIHSMLEAMHHRGPDGRGTHLSQRIGLGHNRLSIIDLETGDQPIFNEDGSVAVILNGEIYNYQQLREDLERRGHQFSTKSDTEVLVHLWEEKGEYICESLTGMYAFALWDEKTQTLFIGRDRTGQKPLYYMPTRDGLAFASEIKALRTLPDFSPDMDYGALNLFLGLLYIPAPWTIHSCIRKLPPAHNLVWHNGDLRISRYWTPNFTERLDMDLVEWEEEYWRLFKDAVRMQMVADVPVGAFLSGGIDSSMIVAAMSEFTPHVSTFAMGFGEEINELPFARTVAEQYATDHHEYVADTNLAHMLAPLSAAYDEPYADTSNIPSYILSQSIRQQVKVALNGDGGDELFGGYGIMISYLKASLGKNISSPKATFLGQLQKALRGLWPSAAQKISTTLWWRELGAVLSNSPAPYTDLVLRQYFTKEERQSLLRPECYDPQAEEEFISRNIPTTNESPLREAIRSNYMEYLPGDLNVKMDMASMLNSLEVRSPFLDHNLADHAFSLPAKHKVDTKETKKILRSLSRRLFPPSITDRPKQGFGIPVESWLHTPQLREAANAMMKQADDTPFVPEALCRTINDFYSGQSHLSYRVWQLLNFHFWNQSLKHAE